MSLMLSSMVSMQSAGTGCSRRRLHVLPEDAESEVFTFGDDRTASLIGLCCRSQSLDSGSVSIRGGGLGSRDSSCKSSSSSSSSVLCEDATATQTPTAATHHLRWEDIVPSERIFLSPATPVSVPPSIDTSNTSSLPVDSRHPGENISDMPAAVPHHLPLDLESLVIADITIRIDRCHSLDLPTSGQPATARPQHLAVERPKTTPPDSTRFLQVPQLPLAAHPIICIPQPQPQPQQHIHTTPDTDPPLHSHPHPHPHQRNLLHTLHPTLLSDKDKDTSSTSFSSITSSSTACSTTSHTSKPLHHTPYHSRSAKSLMTTASSSSSSSSSYTYATPPSPSTSRPTSASASASSRLIKRHPTTTSTTLSICSTRSWEDDSDGEREISVCSSSIGVVEEEQEEEEEEEEVDEAEFDHFVESCKHIKMGIALAHAHASTVSSSSSTSTYGSGSDQARGHGFKHLHQGYMKHQYPVVGTQSRILSRGMESGHGFGGGGGGGGGGRENGMNSGAGSTQTRRNSPPITDPKQVPSHVYSKGGNKEVSVMSKHARFFTKLFAPWKRVFKG